MLTIHQMYNKIVLDYIRNYCDQSEVLPAETVIRRANIYAVKNTWKEHNEQYRPTNFQMAIQSIFGNLSNKKGLI